MAKRDKRATTASRIISERSITQGEHGTVIIAPMLIKLKEDAKPQWADDLGG